MFDTLKDIKDDDKVGDFLFPSLPSPVKGKVGHLSEKMVVIESEVGSEVFQYITHPDNIFIVQKKA